MAFVPPRDRVAEHSTSNSQSVFTVTGALDVSYKAFSSLMSVGDTTIGGVVEAGVAYKTGVLTYSASNEVTVATVKDSNGTFSSGGTKEVFMGLPALVALMMDGAQALTEAQKTQARTNLAAASSAAGSANKLRNSSLTSWFHGNGSLTITTGGGWGAEGIFIVPTGASVVASQQANPLTNPLTVFAQRIVGATSVTGVSARFAVESHDAAPLAGQQLTFQIPVLNNTGGSITPTITVKHAGAQDNYASPTTDVSAQNLQAIADGATGVLAYSWLAPAGSINGISITINFGNNFSTNGKFITIGGGFDLRITKDAVTGQIGSPPTPSILRVAEDTAWNMRFYEASYDNGVAPGTASATINEVKFTVDTLSAGAKGLLFNSRYVVPKRITSPTVTVYSTTSGTSAKIRDEGNGADLTAAVSENGDKSFNVSATQAGTLTFIRASYHWTSDATIAGA